GQEISLVDIALQPVIRGLDHLDQPFVAITKWKGRGEYQMVRLPGHSDQALWSSGSCNLQRTPSSRGMCSWPRSEASRSIWRRLTPSSSSRSSLHPASAAALRSL